MVGCANYVSGIRASNRMRPAGSHIKIPGLDADNSERKKSSATASTDWRKRPPAKSSPGVSTITDRQSYDTSGDICIRLDYEPDTSFSGPQYRYPREKKAPWETVVSAPVWQLHSSASSTSEDESKEVTKVQLKHVNPISTSVNGEDITLPNRFSFDIVVADPHNTPPGLALCDLQRLNGPVPFRRISSSGSDELLIELQKITSSGRASVATSSSSECHGHMNDTRLRKKQDVSVSSDFSAPGTRSNHAQMEPLSEKEARFQRMLGRLQPLALARKAADATRQSRHILDPAIVAMKVREEREMPEPSTDYKPGKEVMNSLLAQHLHRMQNAGQHNSTDSGYGSNDRGHSSSGGSTIAHHTPGELSRDDGQIKMLNPAAAEFRSTTQQNGIPWLAPKQMSRQPLTNLFPDAMPSRPRPQHSIAPEGIQSQGYPQMGLSAVPEQHLGYRGIGSKMTMPALQPVVRVPEFAGSMNGIFSAGLSTLPSHIIPSMGPSATLSTASFAGPSLHNTLGNLPSSATLNALASVPTIHLAAANGFNTFPPAPGASTPTVNQAAATGISSHFHAAVPFTPGPPPQVSVSPDSKLNRPYFPVTTKPRDHDPVKQQMYEAYLEWRKANEPGYHMKCKMRQANRVMRQCHQQEKPLASTPANWKMIADQAKAAVEAAAAAAAAEKKRREESVREELRVKVRELSRDSQKVTTN